MNKCLSKFYTSVRRKEGSFEKTTEFVVSSSGSRPLSTAVFFWDNRRLVK